jgi:predicted PurR-regulated permease PerM
VKPDSSNETVVNVAKATVEAYNLPTRTVLRIVFIILLALGLLWAVYKITGILLLLILSILFAYLVSPLVEFIRRPRRVGTRIITMPRALAIALAYVIALTAVVLTIYLILPTLGNQFPEFASQGKIYWKSLGEKAQQFNAYFRNRMPGPVVEAVNNTIAGQIGEISNAVSGFVTASLVYLYYLPWLVLIPVLAFFLLKDAETFRRSALQMLPRGRWRWRGDEFFQDVNSTLAAYIRAQLTACLFIGVVCALGFTLLGLPAGLVLGLIAGVFEFVPLVGPLVIAVVAAVMAMFHAGPFSAFLTLLFLGVLRIVQDYVVYPRLIGQGIHLHPLAVIFAILVGEKLAGVVGVFLAIPVVAILTVSYRHWLEHRGSEGFADLLESTPVAQVTLPPLEAARVATELDNRTTPDEMAKARPDLTTGELSIPDSE